MIVAICRWWGIQLLLLNPIIQVKLKFISRAGTFNINQFKFAANKVNKIFLFSPYMPWLLLCNNCRNVTIIFWSHLTYLLSTSPQRYGNEIVVQYTLCILPHLAFSFNDSKYFVSAQRWEIDCLISQDYRNDRDVVLDCNT